MANEVNTLNIGGTSYPIYSEGIKVDSSTSGTSFLVADGTGNRKIGVSSAISGSNETLVINSNTLNIGNNATNIYLGNGKTTTAENGTVTKHTTTKVGENNKSLYIGETAGIIYHGRGANTIYIGDGAQSIYIGDTAGIVTLGDGAQSISIGDYASQITIGPNVQRDINRNTIGINGDGELYIIGTHTDIDDPYQESHISMEYDSDSGAMNVNLASGVDGEINIGNVNTGKVLIKTGYGVLSGNDELFISSGSKVGMFSPSMKIESPNLYIANSTATTQSQIVLNDSAISMTANDINFVVKPNPSTTNGFSIMHPSNQNLGITFNVPSASAPVLYMAPRAAYSSSSAVHLGLTGKRFATIYVNAGYATSSFTSSSDERLKEFGDNVEVDLDALAALRKSYYRWNETSGFENEKDRMLGMSAQEVQKIYPEVVATDEDGMLSMAYDRLSVVALAAIDKLHNENKELKSENAELKDRLTRLENLVNEKLSAL